MEGKRILRNETSVPAPMRQSRYIRTPVVFIATALSLVVIFTFLKMNLGEDAVRGPEVKFTGSVPSRPVAPPSSVQLIQARPDDAMAVLLVQTRSRETPRALIPLPRPRPNRQ